MTLTVFRYMQSLVRYPACSITNFRTAKMLTSAEHISCRGERMKTLQLSGACLINAAFQQVNAKQINKSSLQRWVYMGQVNPARGWTTGVTGLLGRGLSPIRNSTVPKSTDSHCESAETLC